MHQKRQIIAGLESQKQAMVSALWSNSNYDDDKGTRTKAIRDIEGSYSDAIDAVHMAFSHEPVKEEKKLSEDNEFFAAAERGLQKVEARMTGKTVKKTEEVDMMKGLDQE